MATPPNQPEPVDAPLRGGGGGRAAILVSLILGGAAVFSIVVLWDAHSRKAGLADLSQNEIAARTELRAAWAELRARRPEAALGRTADAAACVERLRSARGDTWRADYAELKVGLLLLEAEALFMLDAGANAAEAEAKFDGALSLMAFSSGEMWETGLLGRARARYALGKYAEAAADLDQVMTRNASYGAAYYWRSLARKRLGDGAGALADERTARRLDSWPPMRDFMQAPAGGGRDIFHARPE